MYRYSLLVFPIGIPYKYQASWSVSSKPSDSPEVARPSKYLNAEAAKLANI